MPRLCGVTRENENENENAEMIAKPFDDGSLSCSSPACPPLSHTATLQTHYEFAPGVRTASSCRRGLVGTPNASSEAPSMRWAVRMGYFWAVSIIARMPTPITAGKGTLVIKSLHATQMSTLLRHWRRRQERRYYAPQDRLRLLAKH